MTGQDDKMAPKDGDPRSIPVAPPYPNDKAFFCRFFTAISAIVDRKGRRLHEVEFREEQGEGAFEKCPFSGSRHGYLINRGAFREMVQEWDEIIAGLCFFRQLFGATDPLQANLSVAWRVSLTTMFAPLFLLKRSTLSFRNGELPTSVTGLFKIMLDAPTTLDLMFLHLSPDEINDEMDATQVAKKIRLFAEENGFLLNGDYACAGPPQLVELALSTSVGATTSEDKDHLQNFSALFPNEIQLLNYSYLMTCQYIAGYFFLFTIMVLMEYAFCSLIKDGLYCGPDGVITNLSAYERRRRFALHKLMHSTNPESILSSLTSQILDPKPWRFESDFASSVSVLGSQSAELMVAARTMKPIDCLLAYEDYQGKCETFIGEVQRAIAKSLGQTSPFEDCLMFGKIADNPADVLRGILGRS